MWKKARIDGSMLKAMTKLAISRIAILRNQRQSIFNHLKSDVIELLKIGEQQRALIRVENLIKDENMMDALSMIEEYCLLVAEKAGLLEKCKECPNELLEAISSLLYASLRCGEFPELLKIRAVFDASFGKEFTSKEMELRGDCHVNPKIVNKLSVARPTMEIKRMKIKEIALEKGILTKLEERDEHNSVNEIPKKVYMDAAEAALDAFESAAYAAEAAMKAVALARKESKEDGLD